MEECDVRDEVDEQNRPVDGNVGRAGEREQEGDDGRLGRL